MKHQPPQAGVLRRSLKTSFTALTRALWRGGVRPMLGLLPQHWDARIRTLAHYSKLTLLHGQTLDFSQPRFEGWPGEARNADEHPPAGGQATAQGSTPPILPGWIVAELNDLARIEPELAPTPALVRRYHVYHTPLALAPAQVYAQCAALLAGQRPDLVILVPYLVRGGADLGVIHHARAAIAAGMRVAVIATVDADSPWRDRLPADCPLIEFGRLSAGLDARQQRMVLARMLIDSTVKVIHVVNSQLGWELIQRHGKSLVSTGRRLYASVFSDGRDADGVLWSFPRFFMIDCWRYLSGVISDSRWYPDELVRQYGIQRERLHTVYFPGPQHALPVYRAAPGGRVLWASRITHSKRPDLLAAIARAAPELQFDVFGYAADEDDRRLEKALAGVGNIRLCGRFDMLEQVVAGGGYLAFLYTTAWDGLPNVLLEATACGLPVVSTALCGIPEFIDERTGYPVVATDEPAAYVARLRELVANPVQARERWATASARLQAQHSEAAFTEGLRGIPGYLAPHADRAPESN